MQTVYEKELQQLKTWDEVQTTHQPERAKGYSFITTAGHGYLVVPKTDQNAHIAQKLCEYGFEGQLAFYLEEDCEAGAFINAIP